MCFGIGLPGKCVAARREEVFGLCRGRDEYAGGYSDENRHAPKVNPSGPSAAKRFQLFGGRRIVADLFYK
jgi:hypothetical protein